MGIGPTTGRQSRQYSEQSGEVVGIVEFFPLGFEEIDGMEACIYGSFVNSGVRLGRLYDYSLGRHKYLAVLTSPECVIF